MFVIEFNKDNFKESLREMRLALGLTQVAFVEKLKDGGMRDMRSKLSIIKYERGEFPFKRYSYRVWLRDVEKILKEDLEENDIKLVY